MYIIWLFAWDQKRMIKHRTILWHFSLFYWSWETRMITIMNSIKALSVFLLLKRKTWHQCFKEKEKRMIGFLSLDCRKIISEFLSTFPRPTTYLPKTLNNHHAINGIISFNEYNWKKYDKYLKQLFEIVWNVWIILLKLFEFQTIWKPLF